MNALFHKLSKVGKRRVVIYGTLFYTAIQSSDYSFSLEKMTDFLSTAPTFATFTDNPEAILTTLLIMALTFFGINGYRHKVVTKLSNTQFFTEKSLLNFPKDRIGYSDRTAYVMAELSELAYHPVEKNNAVIRRIVEEIQRSSEKNNDNKVNSEQFKQWKKEIADELYAVADDSTALLNEDDLKKVLKKGGLTYVAPYLSGVQPQSEDKKVAADENKASATDLSKNTTLDQETISVEGKVVQALSAQGFVCYRQGKTLDESYIVVSFRGSEATLVDWLTNADALPASTEDVASGRVHRGFYWAFCSLKAQIIKNIEKARKELIKELSKEETQEAKKAQEVNIPIYFTGHSLGGAMAIIAARELHRDQHGACYTFGAPRVGDYDYFADLKMPVFRVVNSSDGVPRVPPGFDTWVLKALWFVVRIVLSWLPLRFLKEKHFEQVDSWVERLSHYRHTGDLRYLTDVPAHEATKAKILNNPSKFDQMAWFFKHMVIAIGWPVKSHSLQIYRNKLKVIALDNNKSKDTERGVE